MSDESPPSISKSFGGGWQRGKSVANEINHYGKLGQALALVLLNVLTLPPELFLRKDFGERYVSPAKLLVTLIAVQFIQVPILIFVLVGVAPDLENEYYWVYTLATMVLFNLLFFGLGLIRYTGARDRSRRGERWHSRCDGVSNRLVTATTFGKKESTEWRVRQFTEPSVTFCLGMLGCVFGPVVGLYLMIAALLMAVKVSAMYAKGRAMYLDHHDDIIESEQWARAMEGAPVEETEGFRVQGAAPQTPSERITFEKIMAELDPEYQAMISDPDSAGQQVGNTETE